MTHQKVITMCHWRRPEYTRVCLEYLSRCHGINDYTVFIHIDGNGDPKVLQESLRIKPVVKVLQIIEHKSHLGCNGNTLRALENGFGFSDFVIHIEDDIIVARDGLRFLEWASQFENDPAIFTVGIWRHPSGWLPTMKIPWIPGHERKAGTVVGFYVWGWATWQSRWKEMRNGWTRDNDRTGSWDTILTRKVRGNRLSLQPYIGRANNIGEHLGTHRGAAWECHWADSPGFKEPDGFERV